MDLHTCRVSAPEDLIVGQALPEQVGECCRTGNNHNVVAEHRKERLVCRRQGANPL